MKNDSSQFLVIMSFKSAKKNNPVKSGEISFI